MLITVKKSKGSVISWAMPVSALSFIKLANTSHHNISIMRGNNSVMFTRSHTRNKLIADDSLSRFSQRSNAQTEGWWWGADKHKKILKVNLGYILNPRLINLSCLWLSKDRGSIYTYIYLYHHRFWYWINISVIGYFVSILYVLYVYLNCVKFIIFL